MAQQGKGDAGRAVLSAAKSSFGIENHGVSVGMESFGKPGRSYREWTQAARTESASPAGGPVDLFERMEPALVGCRRGAPQLVHQCFCGLLIGSKGHQRTILP